MSDAQVQEQVEDQQVEDQQTQDQQPQDPPKDDQQQQDQAGKTTLSDDGGQASDVPEEYSFEAPEGIEISEDAQKRIDNFAQDKAKDLGLSQTQFQKLVEYELSREQEAMNVMADAYDNQITQWGETVKADKEIGGDNLDESLGNAKTAIKQFASDGLRQLIDRPSKDNPGGLGLGNHPEFIRFMARVGRALGESSIINGEGPGASDAENEQKALQRMYPSMYDNQQ